MRMKYAARMALAAGAAVTAGVVGASPAAAITYGYGPWYNENKGAVAYFEKHGDHIKICDIKSDDMYANIYVYDKTAKRFQVDLSDTKNDGHCHYSSAADGGSFNLPENHWFEMTVSVTRGGGSERYKTYEIYNNA
ncbi:hypothetical protein [Streptomyces sp. NPDC086787]|uniref:hypothetical protein n=1 Tax=Streptomyces sp. NPDC086787 TaxID=3365759 RepID=UPI003828BBE6